MLRGIAEEEAAKYLILVDAIRCERTSLGFSQQLGRFYEHLARGIYATTSVGQWPTFGDLRGYVDEARKELLLDGPQGDDYIYRNRILERRESQMYVDYEQSEGEHSWSRPHHSDTGQALGLRGIVPPSLQTANALHKAGFSSTQGLKLLSDLWRPVAMTDTFTRSDLRELNRSTCNATNASGISGTGDRLVIDRIVQHWQYPMYSLDLKIAKVPLAKLQQKQGTSWLAVFGDDATFMAFC